MTIYSAFDQVANLLATLDPVQVSAMKATSEMQYRFNRLTEKAQDNELTPQEKDELDHYVVLERLMRLAKLRVESGNALS